MSQPVFAEAVSAYQRGDHARARVVCERVLQEQPQNFEALYLAGTLAAQDERMTDAIKFLKRAVDLNARHPALQAQLGAVLQELKRHEEALYHLDCAIRLKPNVAEVHDCRGNALTDLHRYDEAIASYERAIALMPNYADAFNDMGMALAAAKRVEEAIASFDRALRIEPDFAEAHCARGAALSVLHRNAEALSEIERALAIDPNMAHAWHSRGAALSAMRQMDDAIASYKKALALRPKFPEAKYALSLAMFERRDYPAAVALIREVLQVKPDIKFALGFLLESMLQLCDWSEYHDLVKRIESGLRVNLSVCPPLAAHVLPTEPGLQKSASVSWSKDVTFRTPTSVNVPRYRRHSKIRVGYFSPDFGDHPVSYLTSELFEKHDRSQFEVTAFSLIPRQCERNTRIAKAVDRFVDVSELSDRDSVACAREIHLDIAVDLAGYTSNARPNLFALRAAPLQIQYIGFLGTMGADFMDYMIADREMLPAQDQHHYTEKIIYLPCYQVNDTKRVISTKMFRRAEWGLPESGFVYCCFNGAKKLNPEIFGVWMRILQQVPGSVLWLYEDNPIQAANLRREAVARGVEGGRLVFARPLPLEDYLARYALADLFLDTLPYNAGATGSDALWAALPVLTCRGNTFAGRYGASMLAALGMQELIASNLHEYEARAVQLGTQPHEMARVRTKLTDRRTHGRLFDIDRFTDSIETAYRIIHERHHQGLLPATITV